MGKSEKGLTVVEILIAVSIVAILAYFSFPRYAEVWRSAKELTLAQELAAINQGVYLYVLKNGHYPASLEEMEKKGYLNFEGESEKRLKIKYIKKSPKGEYLDPFGNPYIYSKKKGTIRSSTPGYETYQ